MKNNETDSEAVRDILSECGTNSPGCLVVKSKNKFVVVVDF